MKKYFILFLCAFTVLSLSACGETENEKPETEQFVQQDAELPENSTSEVLQEGEQVLEDSSAEQPENVSEEQEDLTEDVPVQPSEPEKTEEDVSLFDTSWAKNDYEKLFPQPPFTGWSGAEQSAGVYEMETSQANADLSGNYYNEFTAYAQLLQDCGFTVTVKGEFDGKIYDFLAEDAMGNRLKCRCGDGYAWITVYAA